MTARELFQFAVNRGYADLEMGIDVEGWWFHIVPKVVEGDNQEKFLQLGKVDEGIVE